MWQMMCKIVVCRLNAEKAGARENRRLTTTTNSRESVGRSRANDSLPERAMWLPFRLIIYGHGFDVELAGLYVMNDTLAIIGK